MITSVSVGSVSSLLERKRTMITGGGPRQSRDTGRRADALNGGGGLATRHREPRDAGGMTLNINRANAREIKTNFLF